ncbi:hypothetical protein JMUB7523_18070 [Staphylococcus aureus]
MNQYNTIGFHPGNSRIHQLNATVKLLFLLVCLLYTSPSPRDYAASRMPSSA